MRLGHVALDGTKIKANASEHKAMSYDRMEKTGELEAEVQRWLSAAEAADARKTKPSARIRAARSCRTGGRQKKRAEKIRAAKAELEAEAQAAAAAKAKAQEKAEERRQAEGRKKRTSRPPSDKPTSKPRRTSPTGKPHPEDQGRLHPGL